MEDDIQKRVDEKSWDEKQDRWISDANRRVAQGVRGDALAALYGLHVPAEEALPYEGNEMNEKADEGTLHHKIIRRFVEISDPIWQNRKLPEDVKKKWTVKLQECSAMEPGSVALLREVRGDLDRWDEIDPQSELSLIYVAMNELASMIEIYRRRFKT